MNLNLDAIILDTETNRLDGIPIEVAYAPCDIQVNDGVAQLVHDFNQMFNQRYSMGDTETMSLGAVNTHHILPSDLEGMPLYTEFKLPVDTKYIIGHNISYDIAVIGRAGNDTSNIKSICTLALARNLWPELETHKLTALMYYIYGKKDHIRAKIRNAHSAAADIEFTAYLLHKIIEVKQPKDMEELWQMSEDARHPTHMTFGKHKGKALVDLEPSYRTWLLNQTDLDPYLRRALEVI